ncbi:hypothetical protein SLEP1_g4821 [Rubroshorea leprosula]|uniref:RING-type domain-containing protein n=1 Tax=Rubroshorea leprosula TaxID=152421 RepID=A0AAV5HPY7_9ROSI|nr:hypothetical protein SLEP1_g4821 [Rubroshorea leprosula]
MENNNSNRNGKSGVEEGAAKPTNEQEGNPNVNCDDNHLIIESEEEEEDDDHDEEGQEHEQEEEAPRQPSSRTPFTNLGQVDADLALARTLQEQERAYVMLRMNAEGSDYGSWETGSYLHDEEDDFGDPNVDTDADENEGEDDDGTDVDDEGDAFDIHAHDEAGEGNNPSVEYDPAVFSSDEAYARAIQDAEEREMAARLFALAGINDRGIVDIEYHGDNSHVDTWEDVDPDDLSYEELLALGEVVGTESRGLSADTIASLPSVNYKAGTSQNGSNDSCVICRLDYEDGDTLTMLACNHSYHLECINNWLKRNKVCPLCNTEVSTSVPSK